MEFKELPKNPIAVTISILDSKWKILIVAILLDGTKRFSEIKKTLKGITQKVLAQKLRELEKDEILTREENKNKVEYTLTDVGYSLQPVILAYLEWGRDFKRYIKLLSKNK